MAVPCSLWKLLRFKVATKDSGCRVWVGSRRRTVCWGVRLEKRTGLEPFLSVLGETFESPEGGGGTKRGSEQADEVSTMHTLSSGLTW